MGDPDVGIAFGEDVGEIALALDAQRRELGDVHVAGPVVAMLDEQPRSIATTGPFAFGPHEHPGSLQLVAIERELEVTFLERRIHVVNFGRPRAAVPQHHDAGAVPGGNHALERAVLDWMILNHHGEALGRRIERRTFRHRPRQQHTVVLEPEVIMKMAGQMFLDAEEAGFGPLRLLRALGGELGIASGFGAFLEVALRAVFFKRH
jgi:hypothetical protein